MAAIEKPLAEWINSRADLVGTGVGPSAPATPGAAAPLDGGAYTPQGPPPRSPAWGAQVHVSASPGGGARQVNAEDGKVSIRTAVFEVKAGAAVKAEAGAAALADVLHGLSGDPEPLAGSGLWLRAVFNVDGPYYVQQPPDAGEEYTYAVSAELIIEQP